MKKTKTIDVEAVLNELGLRNVRDAGEEVQFSCPDPAHHYGDNNPSSYMRRTHAYPYICFGCGRKGTVVDFVAEYLGIEIPQAWRWLGERFGFDTAYDPEDTISETLNRILGPKSAPEVQERNNPTVETPKTFIPALELKIIKAYLNQRGLNDDSIAFWKLAYDPFTQRVAIPVRDRVGSIVGFKARAIDDRDPRYLVLGDHKDQDHYGFAPYNSSTILFGLNLVQGRSLIVTEGELNTIALRQAGYNTAVGLPTAGMSEYQAAVIREGFDKVTLFLDSDEAGRKGVATACKMLAGACDVRVVDDHEGDPLDMVRYGIPEMIYGLIDNAKTPLVKLLKEKSWQVV